MLINLPQLKCPVAQDNGMKTNLNHISSKELNNVFCASSLCLITSRLQLAPTSSNNRIETLGLVVFESSFSATHSTSYRKVLPFWCLLPVYGLNLKDFSMCWICYIYIYNIIHIIDKHIYQHFRYNIEAYEQQNNHFKKIEMMS